MQNHQNGSPQYHATVLKEWTAKQHENYTQHQNPKQTNAGPFVRRPLRLHDQTTPWACHHSDQFTSE
jgi:hypothetical protein